MTHCRRFVLLALCLLLGGCATNGYITSVISTGIGLDVSENPQTQVPHVRFGYIRNGVYYIPTDKVGNPVGDVRKTPNVVSKIHVSTKFLSAITITEKFAVGGRAVHSDSAQQLFQETSSERGPHSPHPSGELVSPLIDQLPPLPPKTLRVKKPGNKPQPGELGGAITKDREALVEEITAIWDRLDQQKKTIDFAAVLTNANVGADVSRDATGFTLFVHDPTTPVKDLETVRAELKKLE